MRRPHLVTGETALERKVVAIGLAEQACGVKQAPDRLVTMLLRVLPPFTAQLDAVVHVQARRRDGPDSAGRVGILGKHAHRGEQSAGLGRLKQVGGEHLIDHGAATTGEHAPELGVDRVQRRYVHQHVPAPHEVDRAV